VTFTALMASPLNDYLGSGVAVGFDPNKLPAQSPPAGQSVNVGRFYPAYFTTEATKNFDCLARMKCPPGPLAVSGATYSSQPVKVTVTPRSVDGTALKNYINPYGASITLTAKFQPGSTTTATGGTLFPGTGTGAVTIPVATAVGTALSALPYFKLATPYDSATPQSSSWSAPTPVYFNAVAQQTRVTSSNTAGSDPINSNRGTAAVSVEGGIEVVNGRLQVANAYGSELLRLPVQVGAQYWTGSAWEFNTGDSASVVDATKTAFTNCKAITCSATAVLSSSVPLVTGINTVWFKAPGVAGSATVQMAGSQAWLPSTTGQIVFGLYKSRLIYIREVY
jgi:hypothetical protein